MKQEELDKEVEDAMNRQDPMEKDAFLAAEIDILFDKAFKLKKLRSLILTDRSKTIKKINNHFLKRAGGIDRKISKIERFLKGAVGVPKYKQLRKKYALEHNKGLKLIHDMNAEKTPLNEGGETATEDIDYLSKSE